MIGVHDDFPKVMELLEEQETISAIRSHAQDGFLFAKRLTDYYDQIKNGYATPMLKMCLVSAYLDYRKFLAMTQAEIILEVSK